MEISKIRSDIDIFTSKLSGLARQLSFAGIAILWIFIVGDSSSKVIPYHGQLIFPLALFVLSLFFDVLHYSYASAIWSWIADDMDEKGLENKEIPKEVNWPTYFFFWAKVASVIFGYIFIIANLGQEFTKGINMNFLDTPWDRISEYFGLFLSFIGTVYVAFAIGKHPDIEAYTEDKNDVPIHFAYVKSPCNLKIGLLLIAVGFLLQFIIVFKYIF